MDEHELMNNGWDGDEQEYDCNPFEPRNMTEDEYAADVQACWLGYAQYQAEGFFYESANRQMLEHATIANAWALPILEDENPKITWEKYMDLTGDYADRICKAVFAGKIDGIMAWKSWNIDKWSNVRAQTSQESIARVLLDKKIAQTYQDNFDICLEIYIDRNDFAEWLSKEPDAKEIAGCVLNLWLGNEFLEPNARAKSSAEDNGRNQQRSKIANEWYARICSESDNKQENIIAVVNRLTKEEIKDELKAMTPKELTHIWLIGADEWLYRHGTKIWGKRSSGRRAAKSTKR